MLRGRALVVLGLLVTCVTGPLQAQQTGASGRVTVTYTLERQRQIASDRFAIWIEDETGRS